MSRLRLRRRFCAEHAADMIRNACRPSAGNRRHPHLGAQEHGLAAHNALIDENGRAVPGAVVAIVPNSPFRKRFDLYRSAVTDSAGHVRLNGIAPSDYKVFAWNDIEENAWHDPNILQIFESQGEGLRMREASVADIRLKVIP